MRKNIVDPGRPTLAVEKSVPSFCVRHWAAVVGDRVVMSEEVSPSVVNHIMYDPLVVGARYVLSTNCSVHRTHEYFVAVGAHNARRDAFLSAPVEDQGTEPLCDVNLILRRSFQVGWLIERYEPNFLAFGTRADVDSERSASGIMVSDGGCNVAANDYCTVVIQGPGLGAGEDTVLRVKGGVSWMSDIASVWDKGYVE